MQVDTSDIDWPDYEGELFCDGWREPSGGLLRLIIGLSVLTAAIAGVVGTIWAIRGLTNPSRFDTDPLTCWGVLVGGFAAIVGGFVFCIHEWKQWDKKVTLEKLVAGGFLTGLSVCGFALVVLRLSTSDQIKDATVFTVSLEMGIGICLLSLVVGIGCAYFPQLVPAQKIACVFLEDRYALDEKLDMIQDHPCPWEDRMVPVVRFKTLEGKTFTLRAAPGAYEFARPASWADVRIKRNRLIEVTVNKRW